MSGTAFTNTVRQGDCYNTNSVPGGSNTHSYRLSCSAKTTSASWTLIPYSGTGCTAPSATISGSGARCVPIDLWGGSAFIDCATQASGRFFNYLPRTDGGWSSYSACSASCGTGTQMRTCTDPAPSGGGAACEDEASRTCNTQACPAVPVDGGWSDFSACTVTCDGGNQTRTCTNPAPSNGGANCDGTDSQACNTDACSSDGSGPDADGASSESSTGVSAAVSQSSLHPMILLILLILSAVIHF